MLCYPQHCDHEPELQVLTQLGGFVSLEQSAQGKKEFVRKKSRAAFQSQVSQSFNNEFQPFLVFLGFFTLKGGGWVCIIRQASNSSIVSNCTLKN